MSNLDIHHRAYPLSDLLRFVASLPEAMQESTN